MKLCPVKLLELENKGHTITLCFVHERSNVKWEISNGQYLENSYI